MSLSLFFLWYCCKKFSLDWEKLGLRVTNVPRTIFFVLIVASPSLIYMLQSTEWRSGIPLDPKSSLFFSVELLDVTTFAIIEEVLFRGFFFAILRSRMSPFYAWIWQAILFGFSHIFVSDPISAVGPGLLFGLGMLGTGSLYPGIFAHLLLNILGTINGAALP
jgi:membrane protease YdiL (CAAX protease family)